MRNDTFDTKQKPLSVEPSGVTSQPSIGGNHPVAWDQNREWIPTYRLPDGTGRGATDLPGKGSITDGFAKRDTEESFEDGAAKGGESGEGIHLHREIELPAGSGKVFLQLQSTSPSQRETFRTPIVSPQLSAFKGDPGDPLPPGFDSQIACSHLLRRPVLVRRTITPWKTETRDSSI